MLTEKPLTLSDQLSKQIVPKVLFALSILGLFQFLLYFYLAKQQFYIQHNSFWLIPLVCILFITTIGFSIFSARLASKVAAQTLRGLHEELNESINDFSAKSKTNHQDSVEIKEIRKSFEKLIQRTFSLGLSNDRINNVINSLQEFLIVIDSDGKIVLTNKLAEDFLSSNNNGPTHVPNLIEAAALQHADNLHQTIGNRTFIWRFFPMQDKNSHTVGTIIAGEDITRRKALEAELLLRNKAIEASDSAFVICDTSDKSQPIVYANQAFTDLTGYEKTEYMGKSCRFLQGEKTEEENLDKIRHAIKNDQSLEVKLTNYRKDGTEFINELFLTPVPDESGQVQYYIGTQHDVTMREKTAQYLADAKLKAEEFAKVQQRFFANMNHELRTPINGINGMLSALLKTELTNKQRRYLSLADNSVNNLLHIVNDILEYSKAESGGLQLNETDFDLHSLLEDITETYQIQCNTEELTFALNSNIKRDFWVNGDSLRIQQILQNLLNNAVKFTDQGSIILKANAVIKDKGTFLLECSVADTGIGMTIEQQNRIFDAFSQASKTTARAYGGTGLGLSICRQLCKLMNGDIQVVSEENKGSIFTFWIEMKASVGLHHNTKASRQSSPIVLNYPPRVLVVEDNEINRAVILENLPDMKSIIAKNGKEALTILQKAKIKFDVVLMDNEMPEMDGITATGLIRNGQAGEQYADIPIIAVTAHAMQEDKQRFLDAGMSDYISKPIQPVVLSDKISYWTSVARKSEDKQSISAA